jgi:hypothetical protein
MGGEDGEFGAEDAAGFEDELESGEEEEESLGLDYLDSSKALKDEDDSADFVANGKSKAQKRKLADNGDGVAEKKKAEEEA